MNHPDLRRQPKPGQENIKHFTNLPHFKNKNKNIKLKIVKTEKTNNKITKCRFKIFYRNNKNVSPRNRKKYDVDYLVSTQLVKAKKINSVNIGRKSVKQNGEIRDIRIYGTPGATWGIAVNESFPDIAPDGVPSAYIGSHVVLDKINDVSIVSQSHRDLSVGLVDNGYGKKLKYLFSTIDKSGVSSFKQKFPSNIIKKTNVQGDFASGATKIIFDNLVGVKVGDKIYASTIPESPSIYVKDIDPDGDKWSHATGYEINVGIIDTNNPGQYSNTTVKLADNASVLFRRSRVFSFDLIQKACSAINPDFIDTSTYVDGWPRYISSIYQNLETDVDIVIQAPADITITKNNDVATSFSAGDDLTVSIAGFPGKNYREVTFKLLLTHTGKNFTLIKRPYVSPVPFINADGTIASQTFTNTNPEDNGGTRFGLKKYSVTAYGSTTITLSFTLCFHNFGTEKLTTTLNLEDIITHSS